MFFMALDVSLNGTGYAILEINKKISLIEKGVVKGRKESWGDTPHTIKLALIQAKINELVAKYQPYKKVFIERGFTRFNVSTQAIYKARGAVESCLVGYEIVEISPTTVKQVVGGHGGASKEQIKESVCKILKIQDDFKTEDESDAVAIGLTAYLQGEII